MEKIRARFANEYKAPKILSALPYNHQWQDPRRRQRQREKSGEQGAGEGGAQWPYGQSDEIK